MFSKHTMFRHPFIIVLAILIIGFKIDSQSVNAQEGITDTSVYRNETHETKVRVLNAVRIRAEPSTDGGDDTVIRAASVGETLRYDKIHPLKKPLASNQGYF